MSFMKYVALKLGCAKRSYNTNQPYISLSLWDRPCLALDNCAKAEIRNSKKKGNIRRPPRATSTGQVN